jgi:hypothetical protein
MPFAYTLSKCELFFALFFKLNNVIQLAVKRGAELFKNVYAHVLVASQLRHCVGAYPGKMRKFGFAEIFIDHEFPEFIVICGHIYLLPSKRRRCELADC